MILLFSIKYLDKWVDIKNNFGGIKWTKSR